MASPSMDSLMLLQVMFELESLAAVTALELPEVGSVLVVGHVSLQLVVGGEMLGTLCAGHAGVLWVVCAHVSLQGREGGEGPGAVAGDVGGGAQADPEHGCDDGDGNEDGNTEGGCDGEGCEDSDDEETE